jgi:hypothetical protein
MSLFNLPLTVSSDSDREKRMSVIWQSLSEEEKSCVLKKVFDSSGYNYAVNQ